MSVTIIYSGAGLSHGGMVQLDRTLWLTEDKNTVVEDGDVRARYLLGVENDEITLEEAARLDLIDETVIETVSNPAGPPAKQRASGGDKQRNISRNKAKEGDDDGEG